MDSDVPSDISVEDKMDNNGNSPLESPFKLNLKKKKINLPLLAPLALTSTSASVSLFEVEKSISPVTSPLKSPVGPSPSSPTNSSGGFGFSPLPSPSTKSIAFNPVPFTLNVKKMNRPIPQLNGSASLSTTAGSVIAGSSLTSGITKDSPSNEIFTELQKEIASLKNQIESKDAKLSSSMKSIKTFWSPELKKERAARKEDMARYVVLKEQYNSVCEESNKRDATIEELKSELNTLEDKNNRIPDISITATDDAADKLVADNRRQALEDESFILHKTIEDLEGRTKCYKDQLSSKDDMLSLLQTKLTDNIDSYNDQLTSKDEIISKIKLELKELETELDVKSSQSSVLEKQKESEIIQIKSLGDTLKMKEKETQRLIAELDAFAFKNKELQGNIQSKDDSIEELGSNLSELFEQVKELRDQQQKDKQKSNEDIRSYRNQHTDIKSKMEDLENELAKKDNELSSAKSLNETMKSQVDVQLEKEKALRDSVSAKDQTVRTVQREIASLKMRLDEKEGIIKDKELMVSSLSTSKNRDIDELDELKGFLEARNREIDSLNNKYESLDNYLTDRETALSYVRDELSEVKSTHADSRSSITILESQISEKDLLIIQLEKQRDRLEKEKDEDLKKLNREKDEEVKKLNREKDEEVKKLNQEKDNMEKQMDRLEKEKDDEVKKLNREKDDMELDLVKMGDDLEEHDEIKRNLEDTCKKLKADLSDRDQYILTLEGDTKKEESDVQELKDQITQYETSVNNLENELSTAKENLAKLGKESNRLKDEGKRDSGLGATPTKDNRMIKQLWDEISKKDNRIQELEKQLREKSKQLTNIRRNQTVERERQAIHMTDKMKQDTEADVQFTQLQDDVTRKDNRITMLEDALRESVSIAAEREELLAQHVEMSENAAQKIQELESNQDRVIMEKGITNIKNAFLILSLSERDAVVGSLRAARRRNIEELLNIKQTALLSSISEKDSNIALVEMQSSSKGRKHEIKQLKYEKDKLVNELKEQTQHRMTIVNNEDNKEGSLHRELNDAPNELILETLRHLSDSSDKLEFYVEEIIAFVKDRHLEILKELSGIPKRTQKSVDKLRGSSKQDLLGELQKADNESASLKGYVDILLEKLEG